MMLIVNDLMVQSTWLEPSCIAHVEWHPCMLYLHSGKRSYGKAEGYLIGVEWTAQQVFSRR